MKTLKNWWNSLPETERTEALKTLGETTEWATFPFRHLSGGLVAQLELEWSKRIPMTDEEFRLVGAGLLHPRDLSRGK